jgi:hypothetical protein
MFFFKACFTEVYVQKVWTSSSQMWRAALIWAAAAVGVGWGPPGGVWAYPKCCTSIRCWGDYDVGCV